MSNDFFKDWKACGSPVLQKKKTKNDLQAKEYKQHRL